MIYWCLREISRKNKPFAYNKGAKRQDVYRQKATKRIFIPNGQNAYKYPLKWFFLWVLGAFCCI